MKKGSIYYEAGKLFLMFMPVLIWITWTTSHQAGRERIQYANTIFWMAAMYSWLFWWDGMIAMFKDVNLKNIWVEIDKKKLLGLGIIFIFYVGFVKLLTTSWGGR